MTLIPSGRRYPVILLGLLLVALISSCSRLQISDVVSDGPPLKLERYFAGQTRAHGVLLDRRGAATRHFTADIEGHWNEQTQTLMLDERFVFTDGERSRRVWTILKKDETHYTGTAADVVGEARGEVKGNTLRWEYVLTIPYKGKTLDLALEDWMFLSSDKVLLNRAVMRKFGVQVGELVIGFEKL